MRLLVWNDGAVVEASQFRLDKPYVMQRIHTLGHKAYNLAKHIELLRESSMSQFGFASLCGVLDAERIISKLLELSRVTHRLSCPVAMRITSDGALSFEVESPLYEAGMSLKARRFIGVEMPMMLTECSSQSSVTVAIEAMGESMVTKRGGDIPIWVDETGNVVSLPWKPIFVVYKGRVYTPQEFHSVEYQTVKEALTRLNIELAVCDFPFDSLLEVDEVFFVDVMATTSLFSIKQHRLLSVVTSRITSRMEPKI